MKMKNFAIPVIAVFFISPFLVGQGTEAKITSPADPASRKTSSK